MTRPSYIDWSWGIAPRGLVAGRYQPLADGDTVLRAARPCLPLSAVGSESEEEGTPENPLVFAFAKRDIPQRIEESAKA